MFSHAVFRVFTQAEAEIREPIQEVRGLSNLVTQTLTNYLTHTENQKIETGSRWLLVGQKEEEGAVQVRPLGEPTVSGASE